jgi:hypothetical protein
VKECGFKVIEHPHYSADLARSDYYLFSKLKKDLRGRKFDDDEEVKTAVMEHFSDKEPEYFLKGIELLVHRCEKCVEIKGDYIEKQQSCFICHLKKLARPETFGPYLVHDLYSQGTIGGTKSQLLLSSYAILAGRLANAL